MTALPLIDTHAHVQFDAFDGDREATLDRARAAGLRAIVLVGADMASSRAAVAMAKGWANGESPRLFATAGVHPHEANTLTTADLDEIRSLARAGRIVAIGETGLDYYRMLAPREAQLDAFRAQLDVAAELALPVVVHSRDAADDTWAVLSAWAKTLPSGHRKRRGPGVLHCFDGDLALAQRYVELGFVISIPGPVTYPNAAVRRDTTAGLALSSLVVETDCPYLAPQGYRGQRNEPALLIETVRSIAELRGEPPERIAAATTENAIHLFALPVEAVASSEPYR